MVKRLLVKMTYADVAKEDNDGRTALHLAAEDGHEDVVVRLLSNMDDADVAKADNYGRTALDLAEDRVHRDIVELLTKALEKE